MKHHNLKNRLKDWLDIDCNDSICDRIVEAVLADQAEQSDERRVYSFQFVKTADLQPAKPFERGDIVVVWNHGDTKKHLRELRNVRTFRSATSYMSETQSSVEEFDYCEHAEFMINGYPLKQFSKDGVKWKFAYWVNGSHDDGYQVQTINGKTKFYSYMKGVDDDN